MNKIDSATRDSREGFIVSLEQFEGPLDLLQQLIEKRKLQINTISLSRVTSDYLRHIRASQSVSAEEISHFLYVASILILIKSKSLLPILEYTGKEEGDVQTLEERVKIYDFIRRKVVGTLNNWKKVSFTVAPMKQSCPVEFVPDESCSVSALFMNASAVIDGLRFAKEPPEKKVSRVISIGEVIARVLNAVSERVTLSFSELPFSDRQERIVSFLAVLELFRKDVLDVAQSLHFGEIVICKRKFPESDRTCPQGASLPKHPS